MTHSTGNTFTIQTSILLFYTNFDMIFNRSYVRKCTYYCRLTVNLPEPLRLVVEGSWVAAVGGLVQLRQ